MTSLEARKRVLSSFPARPPARLALVGQAPGAEEVAQGKPFVGPSGRLLQRVLDDLGIRRSDCYIGNLIPWKLPRNDFRSVCVSRKPDGWQLGERLPEGYLIPACWEEIDRLRSEIEHAGARVVVALGAHALWALTGMARIGIARGCWMEDRWGLGLRVMPTYHPAAVLRDWKLWPLFASDLRRAVRAGPLFEPWVWVVEEGDDLSGVVARFVGQTVAVDIETSRHTALLSLAISDGIVSCVFSFIDLETGRPRYSVAMEQYIWRSIRDIFALARCVVAHNGAYDFWHLARLGLPPPRWVDTMALFHSVAPELPRALGSIAPLYLDVPLWKLWGKDEKE